MISQSIYDFKNTAIPAGEIVFFASGSSANSASITGMKISTNDCSNSSRASAVANLQQFTIGDMVISASNGEARSGFYYYDIIPNIGTGSLNDIIGSCTLTSLTPPPKIDTFKNSQYNAIFNNAIIPRRIERSGSLNYISSGVFELDKKGDQITPQNMDAVLSGSAVTASFQESNIYSKAWSLPRYEGSKLDSGSLFFNDPAMTFTSFKGVKYALQESSSLIRSQSNQERNVKDYYFNPPYIFKGSVESKPWRTSTYSSSREGYHFGSIGTKPPLGQPVFELDKKDFKRVTRSKMYVVSTDDIIQITDGLAAYEPAAADLIVSSSDAGANNMFRMKIYTTLTDGDVYSYYNATNTLVSDISIGSGDTWYADVSGSLINGVFDPYIYDSGRNNPAIFSSRNTARDRTIFEVLSSYRNI